MPHYRSNFNIRFQTPDRLVNKRFIRNMFFCRPCCCVPWLCFRCRLWNQSAVLGRRQVACDTEDRLLGAEPRHNCSFRCRVITISYFSQRVWGRIFLFHCSHNMCLCNRRSCLAPFSKLSYTYLAPSPHCMEVCCLRYSFLFAWHLSADSSCGSFV
jgi:hypothetical protein